MVFQKPRLVLAALRGGAGKTLISLGLLAAWRQYHGMRLVPFKKGPDYIDSGWLAMAAQQPCYNLDPFLMTAEEMLRSFVQRSATSDGSLIEGNRGLYDGVDIRGSFSTAELAKLLRAPVILIVDATKVTRTAAAQVLGCIRFDPEVRIAGVLLNQVAGKRHEQILRGAIEHYCEIPVLGVIPKQPRNLFPERHLGLVPPEEADNIPEALDFAAKQMSECVDLESLMCIAKTAEPLGWPLNGPETPKGLEANGPLVIGVIRDAAFQFYYPENLEALEDRGASVKAISSFESHPLPPLDALYIGGGFPETHLEVLAGNSVFRTSLQREIERGLPVYAECGGLMFLCRGIHRGEIVFPMTGLFPFDVVLERKPQGHGYTLMECVNDNPFFAKGATLKGHEFHYSRIVGNDPAFPFVFRLRKGHGIVAGWDGICYKNVLASYSHIHAVGNADWADAMIRTAWSYRQDRTGRPLDCRVDPNRSMLETTKYSTVF
jgi:cobyrinic acid a,c-diamide synthase